VREGSFRAAIAGRDPRVRRLGVRTPAGTAGDSIAGRRGTGSFGSRLRPPAGLIASHIRA